MLSLAGQPTPSQNGRWTCVSPTHQTPHDNFNPKVHALHFCFSSTRVFNIINKCTALLLMCDKCFLNLEENIQDLDQIINYLVVQ